MVGVSRFKATHPKCASMCTSERVCPKVCAYVHSCEGMCTGVRVFDSCAFEVCEYVQKCIEYVHRCAGTCTRVQVRAQGASICTVVRVCAQVCENVHRCVSMCAVVRVYA